MCVHIDGNVRLMLQFSSFPRLGICNLTQSIPVGSGQTLMPNNQARRQGKVERERNRTAAHLHIVRHSSVRAAPHTGVPCPA